MTQPGSGGQIRRAVLRRRLFWAVAGIAVATVIVLAFRTPAELVEVAVVERGALEATVDAEGTTRVVDRYQVTAPVAGRLARIALRAGDRVGAGAPLARLTPVPLAPSGVEQARAAVIAAQARLDEATARNATALRAAEQARRTVQRLRTLLASGGVSQAAVDAAELEETAASREAVAAQARIVAATGELSAARAAVLNVDPEQPRAEGAVTVRAAVAGTVLRVYEPSERTVAPGTPLVELGDVRALEIVVDVLSSDAVRIDTGAVVRVDEWGGAALLEARVERIEPGAFTRLSALGVEEQRVRVIARLSDVPERLGDGYRIEARIVTAARTDVLVVPPSAVFRTGTGWSVFVHAGGRAALRPIETGLHSPRGVEVTGGLAEGDSIVVFPSDKLTDGARIRPRPASAPVTSADRS